ncbi:MAG: hypothetical protein LUQ11_10400, partial [Methylococcaceae bacterium]|nr:hypothetical protein [Methylococcaceae bacterium]
FGLPCVVCNRGDALVAKTTGKTLVRIMGHLRPYSFASEGRVEALKYAQPYLIMSPLNHTAQH